MNKIRRIYNRNRRSIWILAIIIAFFLIILQVVNYLAGKKSQEKIKEEVPNLNSSNIKTESNVKLSSENSIITREKLPEKLLNEHVQLIQEFLNDCNNKKINEAYELISNDCKEEIFKTVEEFYNIYYKNTFTESNINFNIENWSSEIYKITFTKDMMATGTKREDEEKQDYITVVKENDKNKLNINGYIGKNNINRSAENKKIKIEVISKNKYFDYEKYKIKIINNSDKDIILDSSDSLSGMYIEDSNKVKYNAYLHELSKADLLVQQSEEKIISVKYYNQYTSSRNIKKMVFSNIMKSNSEEKIEIDIAI